MAAFLPSSAHVITQPEGFHVNETSSPHTHKLACYSTGSKNALPLRRPSSMHSRHNDDSRRWSLSFTNKERCSLQSDGHMIPDPRESW